MENILKDIPKVVVYLDDILITGETESEHLATLEVLQRLAGAGLHLKREKCTFLVPSVTYLGFRIDSQGLHPVTEKVQAIQNAPEPHNQSSLKSYIFRLTVLLFEIPSKFAKHFSSIVPFVTQVYTMELGKARERCFQSFK